MRITFFAHGTTTDNEKHISSGWNDVELSELGIKQSKGLRDQIDVNKFSVIFCSDLKRAYETAKLTFQDDVLIIPDARLRECNYGKYNGEASSIVEPMQDRCITARFPDGESYEDVKKRVKNFLDEMESKYNDKHIAIISHKAPQLALDVIIKGKSWKQVFAEDWRKTKSWQSGWEYEY